MKIAIGSDHAGFEYKGKLLSLLAYLGHEAIDYGAYSDEASDYPQWIRPVAEAVARGEVDRGIVLGGSGNGEAIVANRVPGVRCTLCWNVESARYGRQHKRLQRTIHGAADGVLGNGPGDCGCLADHRVRGRPSPPPHQPDRRVTPIMLSRVTSDGQLLFAVIPSVPAQDGAAAPGSADRRCCPARQPVCPQGVSSQIPPSRRAGR